MLVKEYHLTSPAPHFHKSPDSLANPGKCTQGIQNRRFDFLTDRLLEVYYIIGYQMNFVYHFLQPVDILLNGLGDLGNVSGDGINIRQDSGKILIDGFYGDFRISNCSPDLDDGRDDEYNQQKKSKRSNEHANFPQHE